MKKLINFDVGSRRAILDQIDVSTKDILNIDDIETT